jgi:hypothetical protein
MTKYLCKFDEKGYRRETLLSCEYTEEAKADMFALGFVEIDEDEWALYCEDGGNKYIRVDGKPTLAPPHVPSKEEKLAQLESEYQQEKAQLEGYFNTALLMDDTETQEELKAEMADLADWYVEEKKSIEGSAE